MKITDYFDPGNQDHLIAYRELRRNGEWPDGFLPHDVTIPQHWQVLLMQKITDAYLAEKLAPYDKAAKSYAGSIHALRKDHTC